MKPRNELIKIEGSLGGEVTKMKMDMNAVVHLMGVLTNLYSDNELAVIREYSTNALDSHIFAGVSDPIEITIPNSLTNELVITDHGLGLSKDEIQNVYGTYGTSTKRESDDVAGCLGLGSKSALAYTSAFTVIGTKDGMRTTAVISLDSDGAGRIEVVDETETDDRNGVTVRIPASNSQDFRQSVRKFFSYWDEGTVLIDGEPPKHFSEDMELLEENIWFGEERYEENGITVIMGGVSYGIDDYQLNRIFPGKRVVIKANMGDVDFVPSREALNLTPRTKDYLKELANHVRSSIDRQLQTRIDAATSKIEVIELASQRMITGYKKEVVWWNGVKRELSGYARYFSYDVSGRWLKKYEGSFGVARLYQKNVAVLVGKPYTVLSSLQRDKLQKYLDDNNLTYNRIFYFDGGKIPDMGSEADIINFEEVNALKIANPTPSSRKRVSGLDVKWDHWIWDDKEGKVVHKEDVIDPKKQIAYITGKRSYAGRGTQVLKALKDSNVVFVKVIGNRETTFLKAFPHAMTEWKWLNETVELWNSKVTAADFSNASVNENDLDFLVGKTKDAEIDRIYKARKTSLVPQYREVITACGRSETLYAKIPSGNYLTENYPLINRMKPKDSVEYVNLLWMSRNGKDKS